MTYFTLDRGWDIFVSANGTQNVQAVIDFKLDNSVREFLLVLAGFA